MSPLTPAPDWITSRPIAHRGYYDLAQGRAENSIAAFAAAIEAGFSIECDLQVTKTREPVVFHDRVLKRMTGIEGNVRDHTPDQLAAFHLADTDDCINLLARHLELVAGKVPLVLELKGIKDKDQGFVEGVAAALKSYKGDVCVMSFHHWICAQFKTLLPDIPRGLTAEGDDTCFDAHMQAMIDYDLQFVSYGVLDLPNKFVRTMRKAGLPVITWTVNDEATRKTTFKYADQMTFEGFDPRQVPEGA